MSVTAVSALRQLGQSLRDDPDSCPIASRDSLHSTSESQSILAVIKIGFADISFPLVISTLYDFVQSDLFERDDMAAS